MSASKGIRALVGVAATLVLLAAVTVAVKWAYGSYDDETELVGTFPHAGQGLTRGSDVKYRGVNVGEVEGIELVDRQAEITFAVEPDFQVPASASVTVRPKTLFGEMFLDLEFAEGADGPWLEDGDEVAATAAATEVEELVASSDDLLSGIDATELAQVITSLTDVVDQQGDDIARAWESGAEVTGLFNDTIEAQTAALTSWAAFQEAIDETGASFNEISANSNLALPEFVRAREDFEHLLATLQPFADHLSDLLIETRPDLDTMFDEGDNVLRVITAREENLREIVRGLAAYTGVFADISGSTERLPDGTGFAYFKNFVDFSDIEALLCQEIRASGDPGQPLLDALSALNTPLDCGESDVTLPGAGAAGAPPRLDAPDAQAAVDAIYGAVGQVDPADPQTLQALIDSLTAGAAPGAGGGAGEGSSEAGS